MSLITNMKSWLRREPKRPRSALTLIASVAPPITAAPQAFAVEAPIGASASELEDARYNPSVDHSGFLSPGSRVEDILQAGTPPEHESHHADPPRAAGTDRVGIVWRTKHWTLLVALAAAAVTFAVCTVIPKTYSASATVSITLPPSESLTASGQAVSAVGDLAAQYASLATLGPVVARASQKSGIAASTLADSVSSGTISGENLISIRGEAGTASGATGRANAIASALAYYVRSTSETQANGYARSVAAKLKPLNQQINSLTTEVSNPSLSQSARGVLESSLGPLLVQRGELESATLENTSSQPTAEFLAPAGAGAIVEPKRSLYTAVAFVLMLLIAAQLSISITQYRRRPAA
jgi:capsular polysaccharide biosynthesis protein